MRYTCKLTNYLNTEARSTRGQTFPKAKCPSLCPPTVPLSPLFSRDKCRDWGAKVSRSSTPWTSIVDIVTNLWTPVISFKEVMGTFTEAHVCRCGPKSRKLKKKFSSARCFSLRSQNEVDELQPADISTIPARGFPIDKIKEKFLNLRKMLKILISAKKGTQCKYQQVGRHSPISVGFCTTFPKVFQINKFVICSSGRGDKRSTESLVKDLLVEHKARAAKKPLHDEYSASEASLERAEKRLEHASQDSTQHPKLLEKVEYWQAKVDEVFEKIREQDKADKAAATKRSIKT
eukprot:g40131.t1